MIEKRFGYYEGSKEDFVSDGLVESTSAEKITFIMGDGEKGDAICARNKLFECGGGESSALAYAEYTGTNTAVEVTTISGDFPETLTEGATVAVKIEGSLTLIKTLNVNGTGAKNVYYKGNSLASGTISRYNTYIFTFDGSYYRIIGVDTDTHYTAKNVVTSSATGKTNAAAGNGSVHLNVVENSTVRSTHSIVGAGGTTVTSDANGNITISSESGGGTSVETVYLCTSFTESNLLACCNSNTSFTASVADSAYILNEGNDIIARVKDSYGVTSGIVVGFSASSDTYLFLIGSIAYDMNGTLNDDNTITFTSGKAIGIRNVATKSDISDFVTAEDLATVATSGSYNDLTDTPTIPAEQVNADWNATSGKAQILNKPTIPAAVTESTISGWGFTKNTGTYSKPSGGIPKTDLASAVQTSLGKADTALQSYTEQYKGTITGVSANGTSVATSGVANIPAATTSKYGVTKLSSSTSSTSTSLAATASAVKAAYDLANGKQDQLVSGTNIKTINGNSILGSGDITIEGGGSGTSNTYIIQDFDYQFLQGHPNEASIQPPSLASQQALFNAIIRGKVILLPDYLESPAGYFTMSGTAEDAIYLTGVISGDIYHIEWWIGGNIDIYKYTKPLNGVMLPYEDASLAAWYRTSLSIEDIMDVIVNYNGHLQINHDGYDLCHEAIVKGLPVYMHNSVDDGWFPVNAIIVGDVIYMTLFYEGVQYHVEWTGQDISVCEMSLHKEVVLDPAATSCRLRPFVTNTIEASVYYNIIIEFQIFPNIINEWNLIIDAETDGLAMVGFPDNLFWANDNVPTFESGGVYELSFKEVKVANSRFIIGTWCRIQF